MSQKIIKIGSSLGVTLRQDMLDALGLHKGDAVTVQVDESIGQISIQSAEQEAFIREVATARTLVKKHEDELQKLHAE